MKLTVHWLYILLFLLPACAISPHHAVSMNDINHLKKLTPEEASSGAWGSEDWTPFHVAVEKNNIQAMDILLQKGANPDAYSTIRGVAPIHLAVGNGHIAALEKLISLGVDINKKNAGGATPLEISIVRGNKKIFDYLIENGAVINTKNNYDITPLIAAAVYNRITMIEKLVEAGADINAVDGDGYSVLTRSASEDKINISTLKVILSSQPEINHQTNYGDTALHWSVAKQNIAKTKALLNAGADTSIINSSGKTAKELAVGNYSILNLFNAPAKKDSAKKKPSGVKRIVGTGTGFFVNNAGGLATNFHVIDQCADVTVFKDSKEYRARLAHIDVKNDLAYLIAENIHHNTYVKISDKRQHELGERLVVLGFPLSGLMGNTIKLTDGTLSAHTGLRGDSSNYQISAPIQAGNSGGPVFNEQGEVIGVTRSTLSAVYMIEQSNSVPQNVNFAVKSSILSSFLSANNIKYHSGENKIKKTYSPKKVFQDNNKSVVMILCYN